jgi:hypothetical protein
MIQSEKSRKILKINEKILQGGIMKLVQINLNVYVGPLLI